MSRREFIGLVGCAGAWPLVARAQQGDKIRKIAVLMGAAPADLGKSYFAAFTRRLEELGWKAGSNTRFEVRWWGGGPEQMRPVVADLLGLSPDVIMVFSNLALALLKPMSQGVPIVFVGVGDPIGDGFVESLARPGGNMTGFAGHDGPIGGKWLEVLHETAPHLTRVIAILHLETPIHQAFWRSIQAVAPSKGIEATAGSVQNAAEIESTISSFALKEKGGVIVAPHAITWANEGRIIELVARHRLPAVYATAGSVSAGGLVSYGHDFEDSFRKTAEYVDRILRGERPGDLPVQQPTKFKLTFNLKTAKVLGLMVPSTLLARADEVIE